MLKLYVLPVGPSAVDPGTEDDILKYLPRQSSNRLAAMTNASNRLRSAAGEVLARYAVSEFSGLGNAEFFIETLPKGKPYVSSHPDVHFNVSHSGDLVACAISGSDVGIDVEHTRRVNYRIAERYFTKSEQEDLFNLNEPAREDYFFKLWTIKESYLKAIGTGLTRSLGSFSVIRQQERFILSGAGTEQFHIQVYNPFSGYVMAVCCKDPETPAALRIISMKDIFEKLDTFE